MDHNQAFVQTGFWGKAGAGCIFACAQTGRILIAKRSINVLEPHTWGTIGGAIDPGENPEDAVHREVREEIGYHGEYFLKPLLVFEAKKNKEVVFRYHNFVAVVDAEFTTINNWEIEETAWLTWTQLLDKEPWHPGFTALILNGASCSTILSCLG